MADITIDGYNFPRDLSFQTVVNPKPRRLTSEQIEHFNTHGYIKPLSVFDHLPDAPQHIQRNREFFDQLLNDYQIATGKKDSYAINGYHVCARGLYDLATHPVILDYVEDLIGPSFVAWGTHFFCKMPHDPKSVPWHQDASYWPLTPARTVTAWLAIDDADEENSAMMVIPGTHRLGHLSWHNTQSDAVLNQEINNVEQYGQPVSMNLKAGQISLHADMLAHGSNPNRSSRRRCGLTIRYCPVSVRAHQGWNANAIWCRGIDPVSHWHNHRRPVSNELPTGLRIRAIGDN